MAAGGGKRKRLPSKAPDNPPNAPGQANKEIEDRDAVSIVGIDWGSTFSAMVIMTESGESHPVNDYGGAPVIYGGRARDISEVPSLISVTRGPSFTTGYNARTMRSTRMSNLKSMMPHITDQTSPDLAPNTIYQTSAELGPQITDKTFAELRAQMTKKLSDFGLTAQDLITKFLEYLHAHLETWCDLRKLQVLPTCKIMASHPVYWKAETIIEYQKMLEAAGFQNVDMVNEGEAAANTVLAGLSISEPENLLFCDLGGETWEFVFYRVHKTGGVTIKDEIIPCQGGKGGMAVVDELAHAYFTEKFQGMPGGPEEVLGKVLKHVQEFSLRKMEYNPSVSGDLEIQVTGSPAITIPKATMKVFHEVALKPMLDTMEGLRSTLVRLHIKKVFLVGGTSESEHWLRPDIKVALGENIEIKYSKHPQCTLVARGAMLAGSEDQVTSSRLNNLHLGLLVSRDWEERFSDETVWGQAEIGPSGKEPKIIEVIQVVKLKGKPLFTDPKEAPWHWLTIEKWSSMKFEELLRNTKVQIFATDKERPRFYQDEDKEYERVAPRKDFNLGIEPRHVFDQAEVGTILRLAKPKKRRMTWEFYYAIKTVCDGVGIKLLVGYQPDMTKREEGIKTKDLGRVKWVVSR